MIIDITFKTDRFNLSVVGSDFINDCCFGEDLSSWLVAELSKGGVEADVICMEDFGWANQASCNGINYLLCVGGTSDEDADCPNMGEWHVMLERQRTFTEKLLGKNKTSKNDPIVGKIIEVLKTAGFSGIAVEP